MSAIGVANQQPSAPAPDASAAHLSPAPPATEFRSELSDLYSSGHTAKPMIARRRFFHEHRPIPYNALEDPALEEFFSRPRIQKHLIKNGWYASFATCTSCGKCDRGPIKICVRCQRFFHVSCLSSLPITISGLSVLIIHCTGKHVDVTPVKQMLLSDGHFGRVDLIDAQSLKPRSSELLKAYDAILVLALNKEKANSPSLTGGWPEPDALGDMLADYVIRPKPDDQDENEEEPVDKKPHVQHRGGIVLGPLTHWETIGGRWRKHKIGPLLPGRQKHTPHLVLGKIDKPGHAVMTGVERFAGGDFSYHVAGALNEAGAYELARWSNGLPLVVVLDSHPMVDRGRVISLNYWPVPEATIKRGGETSHLTFWDKTTDGARLLSNALRFVAQPTYQTAEGELLCQDCEVGKQSAKVISKVYESEDTGSHRRRHRSSSPQRSQLAEAAPGTADTTLHISPSTIATSQLKVRLQRDKATAELQILKEKFRKKFREQIMFSENKKHTVESRLTEVMRPTRASVAAAADARHAARDAAALNANNSNLSDSRPMTRHGGSRPTRKTPTENGTALNTNQDRNTNVTQLPDIAGAQTTNQGVKKEESDFGYDISVDANDTTTHQNTSTNESITKEANPQAESPTTNFLPLIDAAGSSLTAPGNDPSHENTSSAQNRLKRPVRGENEAHRKELLAKSNATPTPKPKAKKVNLAVNSKRPQSKPSTVPPHVPEKKSKKTTAKSASTGLPGYVPSNTVTPERRTADSKPTDGFLLESSVKPKTNAEADDDARRNVTFSVAPEPDMRLGTASSTIPATTTLPEEEVLSGVDRSGLFSASGLDDYAAEFEPIKTLGEVEPPEEMQAESPSQEQNQDSKDAEKEYEPVFESENNQNPVEVDDAKFSLTEALKEIEPNQDQPVSAVQDDVVAEQGLDDSKNASHKSNTKVNAEEVAESPSMPVPETDSNEYHDGSVTKDIVEEASEAAVEMVASDVHDRDEHVDAVENNDNNNEKKNSGSRPTSRPASRTVSFVSLHTKHAESQHELDDANIGSYKARAASRSSVRSAGSLGRAGSSKALAGSAGVSGSRRSVGSAGVRANS